MDRTLVIVKPDAVRRGLIGVIVQRLERRQLRVVEAQLRTIDRDSAQRHYAEHVGKVFYEPLVDFITSGPSLLLVVEGPEETVKVVRALMGATDPKDAAPGTIRGDLATSTRENLIHGSDSPASVAREIEIFFPHLA
ncbi:MAG: nucleoside-diphosphate kinase [Acidimicrobiales bacterium]